MEVYFWEEMLKFPPTDQLISRSLWRWSIISSDQLEAESYRNKRTAKKGDKLYLVGKRGGRDWAGDFNITFKNIVQKKRCLLEVRSNMENNLTSSAAVVCATWQTNLIKTWLWPTSSKEIYVSDMIRYGQNKALMWSGVLISGATL